MELELERVMTLDLKVEVEVATWYGMVCRDIDGTAVL